MRLRLHDIAPAQCWFTADTHFGHTRIMQMAGRPFETTAEMDDALIDGINSKVRAGAVLTSETSVSVTSMS